MNWLAQNWFFALVLVGFIALHLFGHGGCAGHAGHEHRGSSSDERDHGREGEVPHRH